MGFSSKPAATTQPLAAAQTSPLGEHLYFYVSQAARALEYHWRLALEPYDLNVRQYVTLAFIAAEHTPTQLDLGQVLHLDPSQIVKLTKRLAERGLLTRETLATDRRAKYLVVTPAGLALYQQAQQAIDRSEEALAAALSRRDRIALRSLLGKLLPVS